MHPARSVVITLLAAFATSACGGGKHSSGVDASSPDEPSDAAADAPACPAAQACGAACCTDVEVCSFGACVTPGATCHDASDCAANELCDLSLGDNSSPPTPVGSCPVQLTGKCLPFPTTLAQCEFVPTGAASSVLEAAWGGQISSPFSTDVMMTPIVVPLIDTDCNGKVNAADAPAIAFTSFTGGVYTSNGTLHVVTLGGGVFSPQWTATGINPSTQLAAGNIDGLPGNEVVACGDGGVTKAFKGNGDPLWSVTAGCYMPSIADLDGDGHPEVIVEGGILDGATGTLEHAFSPALDSHFIVSDIDGDNKLDVVTADRAYKADGSLLVDTQLGGTWPAIGDIDHDGTPEVVLVDTATHTIALWHYDAVMPNKFTVVRPAMDMNTQFAANHCSAATYGYTHGGGPPVVADLNGDGAPDIGVAGGIGYVAFDGKKLLDTAQTASQTIMWAVVTSDCSSAQTGSSAFDFDADGKAEVVYSDEQHLRIYDGATGVVLWQTCNTTGTLVELPVIADVDRDGHADLVVASNAYASGSAQYQCNDGAHVAQAGVRVFGDANGAWARTSPIWNEHAYHVTNVTPDGAIPQHELPNAKQATLDNFRQSKLPGKERVAANAIVSLAPQCPGPTALVATVRNIGQATLPAGVVVGFYEGDAPGMLLGQEQTTVPLDPAQAVQLTHVLTNPDAGLTSGTAKVHAVVDDGTPSHPSWHECRTDDNTSAAVSAKCP